MRDYRNSKEYPIKSLHIKVKMNNKEGIANTYNSLGKLHLTLGNQDSALYWYKKGLSLSEETGAKEWIKDAYSGLSRVYKEKKDFKNAYEYFKQYSGMK